MSRAQQLLHPGRAGFSPLDVPGLALWFDAGAGLFTTAAGSTPATANADPVGRWEDQSGKGRHATQATAGQRPTLATAFVNGRPALAFSAASFQGLATAAFGPLAQPNTIFAVARWTSFAADVARVLFDGRDSDRHLVFANINSQSNNIVMQATNTVADSPAAAATWYLFRAVFNGAASELRSGRAQTQIAAGDVGAGGLAALFIGSIFDPAATSAGQWHDGHIAELLVYDGLLSAGQAADVAAHLANKYGL